MKKGATTVYLHQRQVEALRVLSEKTGTPMAEYIRRGIDRILEMTAKGEDPFHGDDQPAAQDG